MKQSIIVASVIAAYLFVKFISKRKQIRTQLVFSSIILITSKLKIVMQLDKQKFVDSTLALVNHATQEPIEATFDNITFQTNDPSIFTADTDVNNDGVIDIVGVGEGTATLTVSADATYTDPNTGQSKTESKTASVEVSVTAPPPGAIETDLIVTFNAPQDVPPVQG